MASNTTIETNRLILRPWKASDTLPFAQLNQDHKVTEFLYQPPATLESAQARIDYFMQHLAKYGFTFWAAELKQNHTFIGFIGLAHVITPPLAPAIEIGWRLASQYWNQGLATEGAQTVLSFAFNQLNLPEIIAFTATQNLRSSRVMKKIGMQYNPQDDFLHPALPANHPLAPHLLYRIKNL